ncbi:hypothetical protein BKA63DRAFT_150163 [Paraphoma chrysanthemicola]|nr:hypothetical protein BKA63DRAFT_150163 [Paraphoma chrysanthemicola]
MVQCPHITAHFRGSMLSADVAGGCIIICALLWLCDDCENPQALVYVGTDGVGYVEFRSLPDLPSCGSKFGVVRTAIEPRIGWTYTKTSRDLVNGLLIKPRRFGVSDHYAFSLRFLRSLLWCSKSKRMSMICNHYIGRIVRIATNTHFDWAGETTRCGAFRRARMAVVALIRSSSNASELNK